MMREKITQLIKESIDTLQKEGSLPKFSIPEIKIEHPKEKTHGDYASGIALEIGKILKKDPMEIANSISQFFNSSIAQSLFKKVEVIKPGFINFSLSQEYLQSQLKEILEKGERFGQLSFGKNKKVQVEFISANPTGPLTVGNARGGFFGDVLGNVLKKAGFKIEKAYYINDYGMQVLALGHSVLKDEEAKYKGDYIDYLNKKIKEKDAYKAGEIAAKIIIEEIIKKTTDKMGIEYDEWSSEISFHQSGAVDKALDFLKKKGLVYEKEGAWWFQSSKFGDERDRVVIKSDGAKTYLAGDVAFHRYKFEEKKFDKVINVWGADHYGNIPGLQAVVTALGHQGKLDIIILQFVTLFERGEKFKMSKRRGIYVTMDELLDKVGIDVARFFFLQKSANTHLNFDLTLAQEQSEKNPVYYVQYAHARICSILRKSKVKSQNSKVNLGLLIHPSELGLIKQLMKLSEIVEDTAKDYQLQRLPQYTMDLASSFHQFYHDCRVLTDDENLKKARLSLILATKTILKNTFSLIGISAPEKM